MSFVDLLHHFWETHKCFSTFGLKETKFLYKFTPHLETLLNSNFFKKFFHVPWIKKEPIKGKILYSQGSIKNDSHGRNIPQSEKFLFV